MSVILNTNTLKVRDDNTGEYVPIQAYNAPGVIEDWLDNHPEATTTVQDESLTYKKLVTGTLGYVTPEMFGAVGDGVTDDTQFIQNAVTFAGNNNLLIVFDKKYVISNIIDVGLVFNAQGLNNASIKQTTSDRAIFYSEHVDKFNLSNLQLEGLGTDYTNANHTGVNTACGVYVNGSTESSDISINDCQFIKFGFSSLYLKYCNNVTCSGNYFELLGSDVIKSNDNYNFAIRAINGTKNLKISNNIFSGGAIHISVGSINDASREIENISITNNRFENVYGQHSIYLQDGRNIVIANNVFSKIQLNAIKLQSDVNTKDFSEIIISSNTCESLSDWAINITIASADVNTLYDIVVSGNTCVGGINLFSADNVSISNNIINKSYTIGIYSRKSNHCTIENNHIYNAGTFGVYCAGDQDSKAIYNTVSNNFIFDSGQSNLENSSNGIHMLYCDFLQINGNTVNSSDGKMLYCLFILNSSTTNLFVDGNKFLNAKSYSVRFQNKEKIASYTNNYVISELNSPYES